MTVKALREITHSHVVDFVFLLETHNVDDYVLEVMKELKFVQGFTVPPVDKAGGLSLWWSQEYVVDIIDFSNFFIDTVVFDPVAGRKVRLTWMYGPPYPEDKKEFWDSWNFNRREDDLPWCVIGDLNEMLGPHDKWGDATWNPSIHKYLNDFMRSNGLMDLGFSGQNYTCARSEGGIITLQERLDRALINDGWHLLWPNSHITHLPRVGSDHCPLLLNIPLWPNRRAESASGSNHPGQMILMLNLSLRLVGEGTITNYPLLIGKLTLSDAETS